MAKEDFLAPSRAPSRDDFYRKLTNNDLDGIPGKIKFVGIPEAIALIERWLDENFISNSDNVPTPLHGASGAYFSVDHLFEKYLKRELESDHFSVLLEHYKALRSEWRPHPNRRSSIASAHFEDMPSRGKPDETRVRPARQRKERLRALETRLSEIADSLDELRINSMRIHILDLRRLGGEAADLATGDGPSAIDALVASALLTIANVMDAAGSKKGAQLIIAGAVSGVLEASDWPKLAAFAISMAAWHEKDALLAALNAVSFKKPDAKDRD